MFFVTGSGTGVGKTYVTSLLLRALRAEGLDCVGMKPICCGDRDDAEQLVEACDGVLTLNQCNPVWMRPPVAPYTASLMEGRPIDVHDLVNHYRELQGQYDHVMVEGVGGWRVPILRDYFVSDLAFAMNLPVLLVAANELGALNHTLLTIEAIRQTKLRCAGVIMNRLVDEESAAVFTNRAVIEEITDAPVLLEITTGQTAIPAAALARIIAAAS